MVVLGAFWHSTDKRQLFRGGSVYNETRWWGYNDTHVASDRRWFRRGVKKKKKTWTTEQRVLWRDTLDSEFSCESACACFYLLVWFDGKCIVITHIRPWQTEEGQGKGERGVSGVVAREWKRDMQKGRAVSLRNEPDKRKGLGRWAEETGSTLLN